MRHKVFAIFSILCLCFVMGFQGAAQTPADTLHNPKVIFTGIPRTYEIAGISVKGADNYEDHTIIGYAGLKIGERIDIPGSELTAASKRLWRQGLFSQVRIVVDKTAGDKAWITIDLRTQPRISAIHYYGVKKSERDELQERLQLHKGNQITQNIVNRAEAIIKKYFAAKGFSNANVKITLREDLSAKNEMIVDINVNKNSKVKVHKIYIDGNEVMSDNAIQRTMKKTNEKGKLLVVDLLAFPRRPLPAFPGNSVFQIVHRVTFAQRTEPGKTLLPSASN